MIERTGKKAKPLPWEDRPVPQGKAVIGRSISKPTAMKTSGAEALGWSVGDKAEHGKWGLGTVVQTRGEGDNLEIDIAFPAVGIKRLLAKFAPIKKV
ncbi:hypothetical protein OVA29_18350 [Exiguobacterium sp. SL14]|nr:hypothetical protein [Exiguobacterium sp. SL14]MCY1692287.1 hypothetical protein [Exiguobacterium sp. SL14]